MESACLSGLMPHADWDVVASMIASLRVHLFEHGTIPVWNFMLCGGLPELAVPFSWAYTWPSLFAYALPPVLAISAVWIVLSLVGLLAARSLFERWSGSRYAAWIGAVLYVASGSFSARFNAGHVSFAFLHLVPLMLLLFERGFARRLAGERASASVALSALVAFGFFTGALPHGLIYFYPAWLLLVLVRIVEVSRRRASFLEALRAATPLLLSHAFALWVAAYKLWPIVRWQLTAPRYGVAEESYGLGEVLLNHLIFVTRFDSLRSQPWHALPSWGYNAFVGPAALGLALFALGVLGARWRGRGAWPAWRVDVAARLDPAAACFAALLGAIGLDLALGNANPASVSSGFRHLPVLDGVRAFNRYQLLVLLSIASLASFGFAMAQSWLGAGSRRWILHALALATLGPVLAEAVLHVATLPSRSHAELLRAHRADPRPEVPELIGVIPRGGRRWNAFAGVGAQSALLENGYWVANCTNDLRLPHSLPLKPGDRLPLVSPAPLGVVEHRRDTLTLQLPEAGRGSGTLQLGALESFEFNVPVETNRSGQVTFRLEDLPAGRLRVTARYPGPVEGAWASAAGLVTSLLVFGFWAARGDRSDHGRA